MQQLGQFFLARRRHQELPEGAEAAALVGIGNGVALAENLREQLALAAAPGGDAFAHLAIEVAEVLFHLAKIGQQAARAGVDFQEALAHSRIVHQRDFAGSNPGDLLVQRRLALFQFEDARLGIGLTALDHLSQQLEDRQQARFGTDELALAQTGQPFDGLFAGRRQLEMGLIVARWVELAQPAVGVVGPFVEIGAGAARKEGFVRLLVEAVEPVLEQRSQAAGVQAAAIGRDEGLLQEARDQRCMVGAQQSPGRMALAQGEQLRIVHQGSSALE